LARNVSNWLQGYIEYTKHLEAPDIFHLWAAIGTVAGALEGKVWIDQGYFKWKPNFFIIFVAPPGIVSKSTTLGVGMAMLRALDNIHFGPESASWQAVTDAFGESTQTVEGIGQMSALTIEASELGTFLDPRNREMVDVLCRLWDGREVPWSRRIRSEGATEIPNPWLNFLGCTTPGWIEENFPEYAIKGGFTSRTVFVYAERKRQFVAYPKLRMDTAGDAFRRLRIHLINDLRTINRIRGEYILTESAIEWGTKWYERHWTEDNEHLDMEIHGGYIARKQTHLHKTAMILAAAAHSDLIITAEDLDAAEKLVSSLEASLPNVFNQIVDNRDAANTALIIRLVQAVPSGIKRRTLWRKLIMQMSQDDFKHGIVGALAADYIVEYSVGDDIYYKPRLQEPPQGSPAPAVGIDL